jgi:hypothetical protein
VVRNKKQVASIEKEVASAKYNPYNSDYYAQNF